MLAYYCPNCTMYFREIELAKKRSCPECKGVTKPRLILCGQVMGDVSD